MNSSGLRNKASRIFLAAVLAASCLPAQPARADGPAAGGGLAVASAKAAAAKADRVDIVIGGERAAHRHMAVGVPGSAHVAAAEVTSGGSKIKSCRWTVDNPSVAKLSASSGNKVTVSPGVEGCTRLRLKAKLSNGEEVADSCMMSVYTPTGSMAARLSSAAPASFGGLDDSSSARGTVAAGTRVTVIGACLGRWRVKADPSVYPDARPNHAYSYIDKSAVSIDVASVSVSGAPAHALFPGDEVQLSAKVLPAFAADKAVTWRSSDLGVAEVDARGRVAAKGLGTARITAAAGGKSAAVEIAVVSPVTRICIDPEGPLSMVAGDSTSLSASLISDEESEDGFVSWESSCAAVASVDSAGRITALSPGQAIITAKGPQGLSASVVVNVRAPRITLSLVGPLSFAVGDTMQAFASLERVSGDVDKQIVWSSSDEAVVSVSASGEISAHKPGKAVVTATSFYGESASVDLVVVDGAAFTDSQLRELFPELYSSADDATKQGKKSKSKNATAVPHRFKIALSWKKATKAVKYEIQVKHGKKWALAGVVRAPKTAFVVKSYKLGKKVHSIDSDTKYTIRIIPYKEVLRGGAIVCKKAREPYKLTARTLAEDYTNLGANFVYKFDNSGGCFTKWNAKKGAFDIVLKNSKTGKNEEVPFDARMKYWVSEKDYAKLPRLYRLLWGNNARAISEVNYGLKKTWGGSCFGMSSTVLLNAYKRLNVCKKVGKSGRWKIGKIETTPIQSKRLLSLVNYYQIAQSCLYRPRINSAKELAAQLLDKKALKKVRMMSLRWPDDTGHAILIRKYKKGINAEKVKMGLYKGCTMWKARTYDPNFPNEETYVRIYKNRKGNYTITADGYSPLKQDFFRLGSFLSELDDLGNA